MAKKQVTRRKPQSTPVLSRVRSGVQQMQRDAEAALNRARKEAARLSRQQQRALTGVVKQAQGLRSDFEKLVKRASKDIEARPKQILALLEKEAEKRLEPIVKRLLAPSRQEMRRLAQRVHDLEQLLQQHAHAEPPAAPAPPAFPPGDVVGPSAGD
jgi:transposase